jgi:hypothetical protein
MQEQKNHKSHDSGNNAPASLEKGGIKSAVQYRRRGWKSNEMPVPHKTPRRQGPHFGKGQPTTPRPAPSLLVSSANLFHLPSSDPLQAPSNIDICLTHIHHTLSHQASMTFLGHAQLGAGKFPACPIGAPPISHT